MRRQALKQKLPTATLSQRYPRKFQLSAIRRFLAVCCQMLRMIMAFYVFKGSQILLGLIILEYEGATTLGNVGKHPQTWLHIPQTVSS